MSFAIVEMLMHWMLLKTAFYIHGNSLQSIIMYCVIFAFVFIIIIVKV